MAHIGALDGEHAEQKSRTEDSQTIASRAWEATKAFAAAANQKLTYIIGLPAFVLIGNVLIGHFQFMSDYQTKVTSEGTRQVAAAEATFTEISTTFSKALNLQQTLFFNFKDAIERKTDSDDRALETKDARAVYEQYDQVRTYLRQNIDLLAHKVEVDLDWPSNVWLDTATQSIGGDPMSRLALGAYDLNCDRDMPNFDKNTELKPTADILKHNKNATSLTVDWQSVKHHVLTLYYCFNLTHNNIEAAREWASNSSINGPIKEKFLARIDAINTQLDNEAIRLNAFMTLTVGAIEVVRSKFRPSVWYCKVPIVRQVIDI